LRVLMISKACVVGTYQKKLEELAAFPDVDLTVVVPPYWREAGRIIGLERSHTTGYELIVERLAWNGHFHLHYYPNLGRRMREIGPDIVHIDEEPYNLSTYLALKLARQVGARALFFTWQNILRHYPPPFRWTEKYVLLHADYAIAGNAEAVKVLRAKGYRGPLTVIPQFGVDPNIYRPLPKAKTARPSNSFIIGYAGRLVGQKGVDLLLQAVAGLPGDWHLRILGAGPLSAHLHDLVRELDITSQVTFEPPIPSHEMPLFLNSLDVLVLPSLTRPNWKEQFGRVLLEAMACETPVIGSDSGEIPNVIGDAGLLFPEGDYETLREQLAHLQGDEDLRRTLAARGRERVLARFTQAQIAAKTYHVYKELRGD